MQKEYWSLVFANTKVVKVPKYKFHPVRQELCLAHKLPLCAARLIAAQGLTNQGMLIAQEQRGKRYSYGRRIHCSTKTMFTLGELLERQWG